MKRANNRTEYRLIKAYNSSEWDNCDFAIIHTPDDWCRKLEERFDILQKLRKDEMLTTLTYEDSAITGFYSSPDDWDASDILNGRDWVFVEFEPDELEILPQPENAFNTYELVLDSYNFGRIRAFGKHSGERFYTETFFINEWMTIPNPAEI